MSSSGGGNSNNSPPVPSLASARLLQNHFQSFAANLYNQINNYSDFAVQLQEDLLNVGNVMQNADDAASITADEMSADLQNLPALGTGGGPGGGGGGYGNGNFGPPANSSSNTNSHT